MKSKLILAISICALCTINSFADSYDYMTFVTTNDVKQIESADLDLTISGNNLVAKNATQTLTFTLSELLKMYFSDADGVYTSLINQSEEQGLVSVYTAEGKLVGTFNDLRNAVIGLQRGIYILRQDNISQKIYIQ